MPVATGQRRHQERTGSGHGADTALVQLAALTASSAAAAAAAAKRLKLGEQDEDDLLGHLDGSYNMEKAASRDGDDPAGGGDGNKVGGDRGEGEEDQDIRAIATAVLLSLKRRGESTHYQVPVTSEGSGRDDGDLLKHLDEAYERENALCIGDGVHGCKARKSGVHDGGDHGGGAPGSGVYDGGDAGGGCGAPGSGVCAGGVHGGAGCCGAVHGSSDDDGEVCVRGVNPRTKDDHLTLFERADELDVGAVAFFALAVVKAKYRLNGVAQIRLECQRRFRLR